MLLVVGFLSTWGSGSDSGSLLICHSSSDESDGGRTVLPRAGAMPLLVARPRPDPAPDGPGSPDTLEIEKLFRLPAAIWYGWAGPYSWSSSHWGLGTPGSKRRYGVAAGVGSCAHAERAVMAFDRCSSASWLASPSGRRAVCALERRGWSGLRAVEEPAGARGRRDGAGGGGGRGRASDGSFVRVTELDTGGGRSSGRSGSTGVVFGARVPDDSLCFWLWGSAVGECGWAGQARARSRGCDPGPSQSEVSHHLQDKNGNHSGVQFFF